MNLDAYKSPVHCLVVLMIMMTILLVMTTMMPMMLAHHEADVQTDADVSDAHDDDNLVGDDDDDDEMTMHLSMLMMTMMICWHPGQVPQCNAIPTTVKLWLSVQSHAKLKQHCDPVPGAHGPSPAFVER